MNVAFETNKQTGKDEWLTPPTIIKSLGDFDLDPCSPIVRPWDTAKVHFSKEDNGLEQVWFNRVWLNPPYGSETKHWLKRLTEHGYGIALIFARTETKMFFEYVWNKADAVLFIEKRLRFYHVDGSECRTNMPGAPSVLVAYGKYNNNIELLKNSGIPGKFINLR